MRAATSLEPKVPRLLSSPNSLDDLWPEPSSALKSSFPGGLRGKAQGPLLPSCQPCSRLEWLGLNLARRVVGHPPLLSFHSPRRSRALNRDSPCHVRRGPAQSELSNLAALFSSLSLREVGLVPLTLAGILLLDSQTCSTELEGLQGVLVETRRERPQERDRKTVDVCPCAE